jgi:predicted dehydrogenase
MAPSYPLANFEKALDLATLPIDNWQTPCDDGATQVEGSSKFERFIRVGLLDRPDVDIVDVAALPLDQPELVRVIVARGQHVLVRQPIAEDFASAQRMVSAARSARVQFAFNQNPRWAPSIRTAPYLIDQGLLGQPLFSVVIRSQFAAYHRIPWLKHEKTLHVLHTAIHS